MMSLVHISPSRRPLPRRRGVSPSWNRLTEIARDRIDPPFVSAKAISSENRRYIKKLFTEFKEIYDQLVPAEFYVDVSSATVKAEIMKAVEEMEKEYRLMWNQYIALPFSLHHKKQYLLHDPDEVEKELRALFSRPV